MNKETTVRTYTCRSFEEFGRFLSALRETRQVAAVSRLGSRIPINVMGDEGSLDKFESRMITGEKWTYIDDNGVYHYE